MVSLVTRASAAAADSIPAASKAQASDRCIAWVAMGFLR
jgi:hypothetical protein